MTNKPSHKGQRCAFWHALSIEEGHEPEMVLTTPALNARYDRAGQRILYEEDKSYEDLWRKHNTSSFAHAVWLFDGLSGDHIKLRKLTIRRLTREWILVQVDPDIQVMNDPKSTAEGRDLQLEHAIAELLNEH